MPPVDLMSVAFIARTRRHRVPHLASGVVEG
jgi:hypothetical protein